MNLESILKQLHESGDDLQAIHVKQQYRTRLIDAHERGTGDVVDRDAAPLNLAGLPVYDLEENQPVEIAFEFADDCEVIMGTGEKATIGRVDKWMCDFIKGITV